MKTCPICKTQIEDDSIFCTACGIKLPTGPVCQQCGTLLERDDIFCHNCGARFLPQKNTVQYNGPQAKETSPPKSLKSCDSCGSELSTLWFLLPLVIIIIGVGSKLYWDYHQDKLAREEKTFALLQNCNDPLSFEDFIARFPNSKHIEEVKERLAGLHQEDATWAELCRNLDVTALHNFIDTHPTSPYIKVALHKIDSLDWLKADQLCTKDAYDEYILQHEDGLYISEAYNARDNARRREKQARREEYKW